MNINYPEVFGPWKKNILFLIHINSVKFFKEKHSLKLHKPHTQTYPHDIVASFNFIPNKLGHISRNKKKRPPLNGLFIYLYVNILIQ